MTVDRVYPLQKYSEGIDINREEGEDNREYRERKANRQTIDDIINGGAIIQYEVGDDRDAGGEDIE